LHFVTPCFTSLLNTLPDAGGVSIRKKMGPGPEVVFANGSKGYRKLIWIVSNQIDQLTGPLFAANP
jgi:hypothetical protein